MKLSRYYGKNISPDCKYCLHCKSSNDGVKCCKGKSGVVNGSCSSFRYEPTMREPKLLPSLGNFKPEDFKI